MSTRKGSILVLDKRSILVLDEDDEGSIIYKSGDYSFDISLLLSKHLNELL